eukprot:jgi/Chrzof1/589/Cz01g21130.t1
MLAAAAVRPFVSHWRLLPLLVLLALLSPNPVTAQGDWRQGRATLYGNEPWYWDIHGGSCGFGYVDPDQNTGWDVVALSDQFPGYSGSCGSCYEVQCDPRGLNDGYGKYLDRSSGVCKDPSASVVVRVTDTCPCYYPDNYYSNKRWCCGDVPHMDMSVWAFQKLADVKWGVIPMKYRQVDCSYQPAKAAYESYSNLFPGVFPQKQDALKHPLDWYTYFPNGGYTNPKDGWCEKVPTDQFLSSLGASNSATNSTSNSDSNSNSKAQYGRKLPAAGNTSQASLAGGDVSS